jgi:hypothetical protein
MIRECFKFNRTISKCQYFDILVVHFIHVNRVCIEYPAGISTSKNKNTATIFALYLSAITFCSHPLLIGAMFRDSVPEELTKATEIKQFLADLVASPTEWRAMKILVLGNGQIGKTTLVKHISRLVDATERVCIAFLSLPSPPPTLPHHMSLFFVI